MTLNSFHYAYLIIGKSDKHFTLLNKNVFSSIKSDLSPITEFAKTSKDKVYSQQLEKNIDNQYFKYRKLGRLKWDEKSFQKIYELYDQKETEPMHFLSIGAEFPSVKFSYSNNESPVITLHIDNIDEPLENKNIGECGIRLSIREDAFNKIDKEQIKTVLCKLSEHFCEYKVLFNKQTFWSTGTRGSTKCIMDIFPSSYISSIKQFGQYCSGWKEIDISKQSNFDI